MDILLSYHPFAAWGREGLDKAAKFGRLPFEDASIRTEPNLRHEAPSVSGLCRKNLVVGRAEVGSHLVYVTVKRRYDSRSEPGQFLTAILRVQAKLANHEEARARYQERGFTLPHNCIAADPRPGEGALFGYSREKRRRFTFDEAESNYRERAAKYPTYLVCESLFPNLLERPRLISLESLGISPRSTQSGKRLTPDQLQRFISIAVGD